MQLFDHVESVNDPIVLVTSDSNQIPVLQPSSSHGRNNKMQLFDHVESVNDPIVLVTSDSNQIPVLPSSSHGRNNKMQLFDHVESVNDPIVLVTSDSNQIAVLPSSSHGRNNKMQLFDHVESVNDPIVLVTSDSNQIPVLPSSSHGRNNKMQLFDQNEYFPHTVSSIDIDTNKNVILPSSSHSRNNKMTLFDSNESIKNTFLSINLDDNQIPVLAASSNNRNNKMPLIESTPPLTTSTIFNTTQLSTLPSVTQNKNANKMELFDSTAFNSQTTTIINNENLPALISSNMPRRGSVQLIDSSIKNNSSINVSNIDIPILSSNSQQYRTAKPLINIERNDKSQSDGFRVSDVVLINSNARNNLISMVDLKEKSVPVIENPVPILEKPIPVPIIENTLSIVEDKYKKNKTNYINKPIPISKFSVTLDPGYLNLDQNEMPPTVLNVSDNTKLIHNNKFKTNTQSLAAYYALLSQ
jgi:hypothetical protein